jgi:hypothetical protein
MKRSRSLVRTVRKIGLTVAICWSTTLAASAVQIAFDLPSCVPSMFDSLGVKVPYPT